MDVQAHRYWAGNDASTKPMLQPVRDDSIVFTMKLDREMVVQIAETSIIETIEAFVRFRSGFHGDTGIRDYLYHRLMTRLPGGGTLTHTDGSGTLLAQAEWYTVLKYRKTGSGASRGRFDIGVVDPEDLDSAAPRPLMTFECGRNKHAAHLLRDVDAAAEHEGPTPADISKLAREIIHARLPLGYALEFYDKDPRKAEQLIDRVREWISTSRCDGIHVVVLSCRGGDKPSLTFLPKSWNEQLRLGFGAELKRIEALSCAWTGVLAGRSARIGEGYTNRVSREEFLSSSSPEARLLINSIERQFHHHVKLVFGGSSMTVNLRPSGKLLRINKVSNIISDFHPAVGHELASPLQDSTTRSTYRIAETKAFLDAVLAGIANALSAGGAPLVKVHIRQSKPTSESER
jgi:hypothetical protein